MKRTPLKRKTPLKTHKRIKPISEKRMKEFDEYIKLTTKLRELCGNKSELSGASPDWQSNHRVEPHHINGRNGDRFLDPFNIIMLTRNEHEIAQGNVKGQSISKAKLEVIVNTLRSKQGFRRKVTYPN